MMTSLEAIAFKIISSAGSGKSKAFMALTEAKKGNFEEAGNLLEEAKKSIGEAHEVHREILTNMANGEQINYDFLMVHAEDHLMNTILAKELIEELIEVYKTK